MAKPKRKFTKPRSKIPPNYTLCWYERATRKRRLFADLGEAKREGQLRVDALARGEAQGVRLAGIERLEYLRARKALIEFGIPLNSAAKEYRDARRLLSGASLLTAARPGANCIAVG